MKALIGTSNAANSFLKQHLDTTCIYFTNKWKGFITTKTPNVSKTIIHVYKNKLRSLLNLNKFCNACFYLLWVTPFIAIYDLLYLYTIQNFLIN